MSKTKCTKQTILEEQARLKKEPFMIKAETWSYVVEDKKEVKTEEKPKPKKSSSKKRK